MLRFFVVGLYAVMVLAAAIAAAGEPGTGNILSAEDKELFTQVMARARHVANSEEEKRTVGEIEDRVRLLWLTKGDAREARKALKELELGKKSDLLIRALPVYSPRFIGQWFLARA